jgi:Rrf2 family protein
MSVNTQFSIAVHLLAALACREGQEATSGLLAQSVNTSPSFVRRTLAKLSKAGLVETTTGKSGACRLARKPGQVTLLDVYQAVQAPKAFAIHSYAELKPCPVSCHIKTALENALTKTQRAMETGLARITIAEIVTDMRA